MRTEELLALGMFGRGPRLCERIEMLLKRRRESSPRVARWPVAVGAAVLLGCAAVGTLAPRIMAFAQAKPSFEVASVRAVKSEAHAEPATFDTSGGGLTIERHTLKGLMHWAYGMDALLISGPSWADTQEFDIRAKAAGPVSQDQLKLMLQSLLQERFKLTLHREQKIMPFYSLVVGKGGPKMREAQEERQGGRLGWKDDVFTYQLTGRVSRLTELLPAFLDGRPVEDRTGLAGVYEITLSVPLEPEQIKRMPHPGTVWAGFGYASGVFEAVEQLGLKLEAAKGPVETLVIDHAERPTEN